MPAVPDGQGTEPGKTADYPDQPEVVLRFFDDDHGPAGTLRAHLGSRVTLAVPAGAEEVTVELVGSLDGEIPAAPWKRQEWLARRLPPESHIFPAVVCLCGSTRFYDQYQQAYFDLTMRGEIVLSVGFYPHATTETGHGEGVGHDSAEKVSLDELYRRKIDLADYVLVVSDQTGYFGASTAGEIRYAHQQGKPVAYLRKAALMRAVAMGLDSTPGDSS